MLAITPPEDAYELHINLIRHGRAICRPRPRCRECGLRRMCPWYRQTRQVRQYAPAREVKRSTFVMFGLVVLLLGVGRSRLGHAPTRALRASPRRSVPASLQQGKDLFVTNCGACHTLAKAGTDGVIGPNLDELLAPPSASAPDPATIKPRVLSAINNGVSGRMPKGVLSGQQADEVATFVSQVAGTGSVVPTSSAGIAVSPATLRRMRLLAAERGIEGSPHRRVDRASSERSSVESRTSAPRQAGAHRSGAGPGAGCGPRPDAAPGRRRRQGASQARRVISSP